MIGEATKEVTGMEKTWGDVLSRAGLKRLVGVSDVRSNLIKIWFVLLLVVGMVIAGDRAQAQTNCGAIVGTVTDAMGADILGATVTLKSAATNATLTARSRSGGTYSFLTLNPGSYSVRVTNPGFKAFTREQADRRKHACRYSAFGG